MILPMIFPGITFVLSSQEEKIMKSTLVNFLAKSKTHFIVQSLIANRQSKRNLVCNYSDNYYGDQICRSRVSG